MEMKSSVRRVSVAEYHKMAETGMLPERGIELINGEIIDMSPIGSKHAAMVDRLNQLVSRQLDDQFIVRIQNPILADGFSEPEPDIAVVYYRDDFYENEHPKGADSLLIIEVGDSSAAFDRDVKLPLYAASGVPECWLIDLAGQVIYTFRAPDGNTYQLSGRIDKGEIANAHHLGLTIDTRQIFRK
ncbi:MAG: Uma2 family endonuclease [Haliscomenobacter sp.]|nr:Uma2 family endonuclease [Haliscomenobacter sp.]